MAAGKAEVAATNPKLDERVGATPAIADNTLLYIRTAGTSTRSRRERGASYCDSSDIKASGVYDNDNKSTMKTELRAQPHGIVPKSIGTDAAQHAYVFGR